MFNSLPRMAGLLVFISVVASGARSSAEQLEEDSAAANDQSLPYCAEEGVTTEDSAALVVRTPCQRACDEAYEQASARCRRMRGSRVRAICWAAAASAYGACLARC
jgi:hypothetical protein